MHPRLHILLWVFEIGELENGVWKASKTYYCLLDLTSNVDDISVFGKHVIWISASDEDSDGPYHM